MKKLLLILFISFAFQSSYAQGGDRMYNKFKGELSFGYARFGNDTDIKNGVIIALEPKFLVLDQLAIGGRFETVILGKTLTTEYGDEDLKLKAYQSFMAIGEFYFTKEYKLRPFAGGGAGLISVASTSTLYDDYYENAGSDREFKFGGMIRAGVEIKHFRFALEYNFIPATTSNYYDNAGNIYLQTLKNSYLGVKAGVCFGGGPKNR